MQIKTFIAVLMLISFLGLTSTAVSENETQKAVPLLIDGAFLNITGIPGESVGANHRKWIDVLDFNHVITHPYNPAGASYPKFGDFQIVKRLDSASPLLYRAAGVHNVIPEIKLELIKSNKVIMQYKFTRARITSVKMGSSLESGSPMPAEAIDFNYEIIYWTYNELNPTTGAIIRTVKCGWDVKLNRPI
jgi:type VI secretion system secreted protein Hcp